MIAYRVKGLQLTTNKVMNWRWSFACRKSSDVFIDLKAWIATGAGDVILLGKSGFQRATSYRN
jgi:hypothetical protein